MALEGIFELGRMAIDRDVPIDSRGATSSVAQIAFGASMAAFYMIGNPVFGFAALFSAIIWVGTDHSDLFCEAFEDSAELSGKTRILNPG